MFQPFVRPRSSHRSITTAARATGAVQACTQAHMSGNKDGKCTRQQPRQRRGWTCYTGGEDGLLAMVQRRGLPSEINPRDYQQKQMTARLV